MQENLNIRKIGICMHIDTTILKACASDDRRAQKQLYEYCFKAFMPLCLRYHTNEEDARASLNIAFLKIVNAISTINCEEVNFNAWAKRIMTNTLIDEYRKTKNHLSHFQGKETERELDFLAESTRNNAENDFGYAAIMKLLTEIPSVSAKVFNLYVIDGYNHKEIAEMMEMSEGTSKWHLSTARKLLREKLEKMNSDIPQKMVI